MNKIQKKNLRDGLLIIGVMLGLIIFMISFVIDDSNRASKVRDCLKPVAESVCVEKGYEYRYATQEAFFCNMNEREKTIEKYYFLKEEIEKCSGEN